VPCGLVAPGIASSQTDTRNTQPATTAPSGANVSVLLCLLFFSMCAQAADAEATHSYWAIILTITDLATGAQLEQRELDSDLRFDGPIECKSIVAKVGHIPRSDHFAAALTCRKIGPTTDGRFGVPFHPIRDERQVALQHLSITLP
jgi:hypothetical protein